MWPAAVAARPLTSREPGSGTRGVSEQAARAAEVTLAPPEVELTTTAAVLGAVAAGGAPTFVSRRAVVRELAAGVLVEVPILGFDLHRDLTAVRSAPTHPRAGRSATCWRSPAADLGGPVIEPSSNRAARVNPLTCAP